MGVESQRRWSEIEDAEAEDLDVLLPPKQITGPDENEKIIDAASAVSRLTLERPEDMIERLRPRRKAGQAPESESESDSESESESESDSESESESEDMIEKKRPRGRARRAITRFGATDFETNPQKYHELKQCAIAVLKKYNSQMGTNYRFVDIKDARYKVVSFRRFLYNITFEASNNSEESDTFEANAVTFKDEKDVISIEVLGFNIKKPESEESEESE